MWFCVRQETCHWVTKVYQKQETPGVVDGEKLKISGRRRELVEGRGFGEPELTGSWVQTGLGQDKALVPTRR